MVQAVVVDHHSAHHDWIVPRRVMCAFFWVGIILLFTGIILLVTSKHKGLVYQSWGSTTLGLGFCLLMICFILCLHAYCVITVSDDIKVHQPVHPPNPAALVNGHATRNTTLPRNPQAQLVRPGASVKPVHLVIIEREPGNGNIANQKVVSYIPGEHQIQIEKEATKPAVRGSSDSIDCSHRPTAGVKLPESPGRRRMRNGHPVREKESPEIEITCAPTRLKDDPDVRPKTMTDYRPPPYSVAMITPASEGTPLKSTPRSVAGSVRVTQAPSVRNVDYDDLPSVTVTSSAPRPVYTARVTELPAEGAVGSSVRVPVQPVPVYGRRYPTASAHVEQIASRPPPAPHSQSRPTPTGIAQVRGPGNRHIGGSSRVFRPIHNPGGPVHPTRELLAPDAPPGRVNPRLESPDDKTLDAQRSVVFLDPQHGITESKVSIYDNVQYIHV